MQFMRKHELWKARSGKKALTGGEAKTFNALHNETHTPRVGGVLVWGSALAVLFLFAGFDRFTDHTILEKLNFLSRSQTWLLAFTLAAASLLGLADDMLQIWTSRHRELSGGIDLATRIVAVSLIALVGAFWFYFKLDWRTIYIPGMGNIFIGAWYIPFFVVADAQNLFLKQTNIK